MKFHNRHWNQYSREDNRGPVEKEDDLNYPEDKFKKDIIPVQLLTQGHQSFMDERDIAWAKFMCVVFQVEIPQPWEGEWF